MTRNDIEWTQAVTQQLSIEIIEFVREQTDDDALALNALAGAGCSFVCFLGFVQRNYMRNNRCEIQSFYLHRCDDLLSIFVCRPSSRRQCNATR